MLQWFISIFIQLSFTVPFDLEFDANPITLPPYGSSLTDKSHCNPITIDLDTINKSGDLKGNLKPPM